MKAKKFLAAAFKFVILAVVAAFLALHSINLFKFVFPADQQYYAFLGFGLTGLGAVAYLIMFLWEGGTILQKSVSLAMAVICSIGEVLAAIFGMQIEGWQKAGFTLTETDFQSMLLVVGILSIAHFFALITYFAGDKIGELFTDRDGDGIPDAVDQIDNRTGKPFARKGQAAYAADADWKAEAKALGMWDPNDPNDTPFERSRPELHRAIVESRKAEGQGANGTHKAVTDPTNRQR